MENDRVLVATTEKDVPVMTMLFGEHENEDWNSDEIDWNAIDSRLVSRHIAVTRPELNGKKLGSLRLRNSYGINISRVSRAAASRRLPLRGLCRSLATNLRWSEKRNLSTMWQKCLETGRPH